MSQRAFPVDSPALSPTLGPSPSAGEAPGAVAAGTRRLLEGPIAQTLLWLAAPNVVVMVVQAVVNAAEAVYIGWLGPEALAGVSLVFPLIMLMQTTSAGGMGGGVASAVARALGAGRRTDADALVWHALVLALGMASLFTAGMLLTGPALYRAMGGSGAVLEAAVAYSNLIFGGAVAVWLLNILASVVRGTGNMALPAGIMATGAVVTLAMSPALIMGWGPPPRLGIVGGAAALLSYYALAGLVLLGYLVSGRGLVRLSPAGCRLQARLFLDILRVGAPSSLITLQSNLTLLLLTVLAGPFGTFALAGYGMGARLEYLQIPLVFGLGSALVTMVGTNVGAGQGARALRVAWVGGAMAGATTGTIGLVAAVWPHAWLGLFSSHSEVLATGSTYLRIVGPTYGFLGLGLALYFSSQGAGRTLWPVTAGSARLLLAVGGGWVAIHWLGAGLLGLFVTIAFALVVFGLTMAVATRASAWGGTR